LDAQIGREYQWQLLNKTHHQSDTFDLGRVRIRPAETGAAEDDRLEVISCARGL